MTSQIAGSEPAGPMTTTENPTRERLVVIGNGMAPGRALEKLFERAPDAFDVTIFNAEPRVNYDRIMLSPVLSGEKSYDQIVIHGDGWYVKNGVTLYKGTSVTQIDRAAKTVGLLGLEAAVGLKEQGMDVTVLHLMPTLMERQLDTPAGHLLQKAIEARGITVITKANTKAILGEKKVEAVLLEDGTRLPADLVVMAVGIKPNAQMAKDAGLTVNRGIVVDPAMRTSDPDIYAVGECAEAHGQVFGLVAPLYEMADVIASQLAGDSSAAFTPSAVATKRGARESVIVPCGPTGSRSGQPVRKLYPASAEP